MHTDGQNICLQGKRARGGARSLRQIEHRSFCDSCILCYYISSNFQTTVLVTRKRQTIKVRKWTKKR